MPNHFDNEDEEGNVPFFPNVLLAEASLAIAVIGLLIIFVSLFPLRLAEKFDPSNPPTVLEPEWYFMGVYQLLKTERVEPIYGIALMAGLGIFLVLVPFIDRGTERRPLKRPAFTGFALYVIVQFLALTIYGYFTPGQVASFSDVTFLLVLVATNLIGLLFGVLAIAAHKRVMRSLKS